VTGDIGSNCASSARTRAGMLDVLMLYAIKLGPIETGE